MNRRKAVIKLAKQHHLIANQIKHFQHQAKAKRISKSQAIAIEYLNAKGMMKDHSLAQSINDLGFYGHVNELTYKAEWFRKTIMKISRVDISSRLCNICYYKNKDPTRKIREW